MHSLFQYTLFSILMFSLSLSNLTAQSARAAQEAREERARQAINKLKNGYLLVRLPSKHNKLSELERLSKSMELDAATKKKLRQRYDETIADRDAFNKNMMAAFNEHYQFSEVFFFYDTSSLAIKSGQLGKVFLDEALQPTIDLPEPDKSFLVLRSGTTDPSVTSGIEAMVVMDAHFVDLERPFPYYIKLKSLGHILEALFAPKKRVIKSATSIAKELDAKLNRFYGPIQ